MVVVVRRLVCAALLLGLPGIAWAQTHQLSGTVFGGGSALANTTVEALADGTTTVLASSTTSSTGHYTLSLDDGTYDLRVTPPSGSGFGQETVQNVTITADRVYDVILLSSGSSGGSGSVSGTIRGRNGAPVPNVQVNVYGSAGTNWGRTDADGQYALSIGPGPASMEFYGSGPAGVAPSSFYVQRYNLTVNGPTTVDLDLNVVSLSGQVSSPTAQPVAGASVSISTYQSFSGGYLSSSGSTTTDAQGTYTVLALSGNGTATVMPPAGSPLLATSTAFTATSDLSQLNLTLGAAVEVSGTVRGRNGAPVPNVQVYLYSGASSAAGRTDTNGQYRLPAGVGNVTMEFYGGGPGGVAPSNFYVQRYGVIVNGPTTVDIDLHVVSVGGHVFTPAGDPLADARVNLSTFQSSSEGYSSSSASVTTDAQGAYSVLMSAGTGTINALPPTGSPWVAVSSPFVASADTQLDQTLGTAVAVSGTVRGRDGAPVPNVQVYLYGNVSAVSARTDASGQYTLQAGTGMVTMEFYGGGPTGVAPASFYVQRYQVAVTGPTTVDLNLSVVSVSGTVTDSNGAPVPNVAISASSWQYASPVYWSSNAWVSTDSRGAYTYLMFSGNSSFNVSPPTTTGFLPASLSFPLGTDLTQTIILQHPDAAPPRIVAGPLVVHLSDTSVSVSWTTDEIATSRVDYGLSGALTSSVIDNALTASHTMTLVDLAPQAIYTFSVRSADGFGNGPATSAEATFTTQAPPGDLTPPVIIDGPQVVFTGQTSVIVQWKTDEPASTVLEYGLTGALGATLSSPAGRFETTHTALVSGLSPVTTYSARVTAVDPDGNTFTGLVFNFVTAAAPDTRPPVISDLAIVSKSDTQISLSWTTDEPSTSGVSYNDGARFDLLTDPALTRSHLVTLSGLRAQTTYNITIASTDAVGNGPTLVGPYSVTTNAAPDTTPPVITDVQATDITTSSAVVSWITNEPSTSSLAYGTVSGAPDGSAGDLGAVLTHHLTLTGLRDNTLYYFTVKSIDGAGNQAATSELSFRTASMFVDTPPTAPGPISAPVGPTAAVSFDISWSPAIDDVGLTSYEVLRNGVGLGLLSAVTTGITESGLAEGVYTYQIRATDTAGHTSLSTIVTVTIDRTGPVIVVPPDISVEVTTATAIVDYTVTSSDAVDGPVVAACAPGSGSAFPVGTNVVECAAADAAGNQTLARFTVTVRTPPNISSTPVGSNVLAEPEATLPDGSTRDVTVSFDSVTASGLTTVTTSSSGPPPPSGFKLGTPPIYYELSTTSTFQGVATVCFSWQEGEIQNEARTRLLHYENGGWQDVTTSVDVNANVVCGRVTSFSPFAVVETAYRFSGFLSPLVTGRSVVLQAKQTRTVPVKFQLLFQDQPTGEPGAQIALYALDPAGNIVGGNLAVDAGSANGGATAFRYDSQSQHYIFNLSTKNLAVGSYRVIVTIDDGTTAKADLVLK